MKNEFINPDPQWKGVKKNYFSPFNTLYSIDYEKNKNKTGLLT